MNKNMDITIYIKQTMPRYIIYISNIARINQLFKEHINTHNCYIMSYNQTNLNENQLTI